MGLVRCRLDDSNNSVKLVILVLNHLLLVSKELFVLKVTRLVELPIVSSLVPVLVCGGRGQSSLVVLNAAILLGDLTTNEFFDLVDEVDTSCDFFLVDARVLVRLVLIVVHQLVEVAHVRLQGCPRRLHQVLLTGDGLAGSRVRDLVDLVSQTLDPLLGFSVVPLELICAHFVCYRILIINY